MIQTNGYEKYESFRNHIKQNTFMNILYQNSKDKNYFEQNIETLSNSLWKKYFNQKKIYKQNYGILFEESEPIQYQNREQTDQF